ncbi:peptide chain release factor N(5)-glutamine methyltransferase [Thalassomonas actiniarum]|uniref:Release factor glutamine methyltransferase n=1 Tax=Thalassomonas actiniarum TaxID=485447 RepID=A0AAF0C2F1_9GAMM|nr:peptide chain release factor N(5)-glutamine methyltransferase [Thalassomonas actiniarum]WDD97719.1 peptide chain release factor N(5)-glutamine methyltransferase [Thalassomonas actiniarum]
MSNAPLARLVEQGAALLLESSDSARLDAQVLLCHVLGKELSYLHTWPEKIIADEVFVHFIRLLERRQNGEPVAYITGIKEFWSLPLKVSPATLIPRPDTEVLVEQVLACHQQNKLNCLDLGTGTGAIALALASEQPGWQLDAVDFNIDAVALARENARQLKLERVKIYQSDWFKQVAKDKKFEVIVSNPPYIDGGDKHLSEGDVRFEPETALVAAENGLADIITIATGAKDYLADGGSLYFEHGFEQGLAVRKILTGLGYTDAKTTKDFAGNDRITQANWIINKLKN